MANRRNIRNARRSRRARSNRRVRANRRIQRSNYNAAFSSNRAVSSRRIAGSRIARSNETIANTANRRALWQTYKQLQTEADRAWTRFRSDVEREANIDVLLRDHTHLLLLLGECDYMARECMQFAPPTRIRA